ncbi:unnamed protein product [Rhizophagus irregularis]|nr:unnamed protein product [Rhizophagus irregularis]
MLIQHLANYTKNQSVLTEIIKRPTQGPLRNTRRPNDGQNTNSPQNNPGQSRTSYNKRPSFKQLIVRFEDKSAVDYIYNINLWSIIIENFSVRILPGNQSTKKDAQNSILLLAYR